LGPTLVGSYSKIGSGSVVLQHVPEYSTVIGVPGRIVFSGVESAQDGADGEESFPDPVARAIEDVLERLPKMEKEIQELRSNIKEQEVSSLDSFTEKKRTII
jgi:serine O-acetyltransferase